MNPTKGRTLVASAARTATGSSEYIVIPQNWFGGKFRLEVTAASGTSPTLDLSIATTVDDGTLDIVCWRFAQCTDGTDRELTTVWGCGIDASVSLSAERAALAATGGALSLPTPISDKIKFTWTIGGTNPSFTFKVILLPWRYPMAKVA